MKLNDIIKWTGAEVVGAWQKVPLIQTLSIDSRKILSPANTMFIAIEGKFRDGHDYLHEAYRKGVRCFLIEADKQPAQLLPEAVFLLVEHPLKALQKLAVTYRQQFDYPVLGITGSNGKTMVKEWLYQVLSPEYHIVRNPKSYNSQVGVPLSLWEMKPEFNLGLFEAGISRPGEMVVLEKMIRPTWGLITNIGDAHSEGFKDQTQKIREKMCLFKEVERLFYCWDYPGIREEVQRSFEAKKTEKKNKVQLCAWSRTQQPEVDLWIKNMEHTHGKTRIEGLFLGENKEISISFVDEASIENAIHCWNVLLHLKFSDEVIKTKIARLTPVAMRLETVGAVEGSLLLNDTYNSDLNSLRIALEAMESQSHPGQKTLILSDLLQSGAEEDTLYQTIADWLQDRGLQHFYGIGAALCRQKARFSQIPEMQSHFFESTADFLEYFGHFDFGRQIILLKGARAFKFEKIAHLLEQKTHQTILEINRNGLRHNFLTYKEQLPQGTKFMVMVKAFAYGSGSYEVAHVLQDVGADYLAVAYTDEGVQIRKAGIDLPIMVMNPEPETFSRLIYWHLEPEIFSFQSLLLFIKALQKVGLTHYPIHLKLDTGMHRLGFVEADLPALKKQLAQGVEVEVRSIFSHLAGSEAAEFDWYTKQQVTAFKKMSAVIAQDLPKRPLCHLLNSTGITRHPEYHFDMVRLGIGLYGVDGSDKLQEQLENVSTLKTTIAQIHELEAGDYVGYDLKGVIKQKSRIATVNIGYADGLPRAIGNKGAYMLVHGQKAPLVGAICMDMCMLDVSQIHEAKAGDRVLVFGEELPIRYLAEWAGTIPYEIMTGISPRVNRIYIDE